MSLVQYGAGAGISVGAALAAHYAKELAKEAGKEAVKKGERAIRSYLSKTEPPVSTVSQASTTSAPTAAPRSVRRRADRDLQAIGVKQQLSEAIAVQANAAVTQAGTVAVREPKVTTSKDGSTKRVKHRELISFINAPQTGIADEQIMFSSDLNPGSGSMGAWLERESSGWEQYNVNACSASWVPSVGTSTNGVVAIIPDYDPTDAPPATMADASAFQNSTFFPVHQCAISVLDHKAMMQPGPRKFVREPGTIQHQRTSDCGALFVFMRGLGVAADTLLGSLWIEYDITFSVPHVLNPDADLLTAPVSMFTTGATSQVVSATHTAAGNGIEWIDLSANNLQIVQDAQFNLVLPRGLYRIDYQVDINVNGSFVAVAPGFVGLAGTAVDNYERASNRVTVARRSGGGNWIVGELLQFNGSAFAYSRGSDSVRLFVQPGGSSGGVTVTSTATTWPAGSFSETSIMFTRVDAD